MRRVEQKNREKKKNAMFASPWSVICAHSYSATLVCVEKEKQEKKGKGVGQ